MANCPERQRRRIDGTESDSKASEPNPTTPTADQSFEARQKKIFLNKYSHIEERQTSRSSLESLAPKLLYDL
jgi:hypothetical protein